MSSVPMMASVQQNPDPPVETICNMTSCGVPLSQKGPGTTSPRVLLPYQPLPTQVPFDKYGLKVELHRCTYMKAPLDRK